ncbi:MAG: hypothetical protein MHM6MM_004584 [Cercozoa sp. M6MM]
MLAKLARSKIVQKLKQEVSRLRKSYDDARNHVLELRKENATLSTAVSNLRPENERLRKQRIDLKKHISAIKLRQTTASSVAVQTSSVRTLASVHPASTQTDDCSVEAFNGFNDELEELEDDLDTNPPEDQDYGAQNSDSEEDAATRKSVVMDITSEIKPMISSNPPLELIRRIQTPRTMLVRDRHSTSRASTCTTSWAEQQFEAQRRSNLRSAAREALSREASDSDMAPAQSPQAQTKRRRCLRTAQPNRNIIAAALKHVCLAGPLLTAELRECLRRLHTSNSHNFIIELRSSTTSPEDSASGVLRFGALHAVVPAADTNGDLCTEVLFGEGSSFSASGVASSFKFDCGSKTFLRIPTPSDTITLADRMDAVVLVTV